MRLFYTKEPGTWVMFLIAFIAGAIKAGSMDHVTVIVFVSLSLFLMAKGPVASYLKKKDQDLLWSIGIYILIGSAGSLYSILSRPYFIVLYGTAAVLIVFFFFFLRKGFPLFSEVCGMAIMGIAAGIAASINSAILPNLYLCLMFFAFYMASSFRVRFTIKKYRLLSGVYSGLIMLFSAVMVYTGNRMFVAFLPLIEDIYASISGKRDDFKRLGIIETIKSVVFAFLLVVS